MAAGKAHDPSCTCKNGEFGAARGGNILGQFAIVNFDMLWRNIEGVKMI